MTNQEVLAKCNTHRLLKTARTYDDPVYIQMVHTGGRVAEYKIPRDDVMAELNTRPHLSRKKDRRGRTDKKKLTYSK